MSGQCTRLKAFLADVKAFVDEEAEVFLECNAVRDPVTHEPAFRSMRPTDRLHYRALCGLSRRIERELKAIEPEASE
ncbi:MAG: hypothetical protein H6884_09665 [Rhodobiaceae bacterium]|nr:hypothetical protein [Rhodobiaceae bacterium]